MDITTTLPQRLSELMDEYGYTPLRLATALNINRNTVTKYLTGVQLPDFALFVQLTELFGCSADYLLGLQDYTPDNVTYRTIPPFGKRLRELLAQRNISQYCLNTTHHISYDCINKWLKGTTLPRLDSLCKLATILDCSVDYLIGKVQ